MSKTVLITGCSSGLGLKTALLFAQKGHSVYATMRDIARQDGLMQEAKALNLELQVLMLDVTDAGSIAACVKQVQAEAGGIDVLVNNAGAGFAKTTEQTTDAEIVWINEVNHLSVVRCTKAVLPGMRRQGSGRIINVSSVGGLVGQPFNELYCAAKFAVEGFTEAMASYITPTFGIHFTAVEPGGISTPFTASALNRMGEVLKDNDPYKPLFDRYLGGMRKRAEADKNQPYQTAEEVAKVIVDVAEMQDPPVRIRTSEWAEELCRLKTQADPDGRKMRDEVVKRFLG
ncbi:MAG: SDR family oxidoreductase [Flavobacteriales bacterium]|nr:SDR family oxidoreductase [Flavobacteriales bacterium]